MCIHFVIYNVLLYCIMSGSASIPPKAEACETDAEPIETEPRAHADTAVSERGVYIYIYIYTYMYIRFARRTARTHRGANGPKT